MPKTAETKRIWKNNLIPFLGLMIISVVLTLFAYRSILQKEESTCWRILEESAQSVSQEITLRMEDNFNLLELSARALAAEDCLGDEAQLMERLKAFRKMTIYKRLDVVFPDGRVLLENGHWYEMDDEEGFDALAAKGEVVTERATDIESGTSGIYCLVPIKRNEQTVALLCGFIDCKMLQDEFQVTVYNGQVMASIVDSTNGDFLMEGWDEELGNAYEPSQHELLTQYTNVDLEDEIRNLRTGTAAYKANNRANDDLYICYMPVGVYNWELLVVVEQGVVFSELNTMKRIMVLLTLMEVLLIGVYSIWNLFTIRKLAESRADALHQQDILRYMSYNDGLTGLFNRNRYIKTLEEHRKFEMQKVGVVYIDLNGLKRANDEKGHSAGDQLLKKLAQQLQESFPDKAYRVGGDEFVVAIAGMTEEDFKSRLREFYENAKSNGVSFAYGAVWKESCTDLEELVKSAERRMYADKARYYQRPENDRRRRRDNDHPESMAGAR